MTQLNIIFLGTGGSWPTIKRNVTSIAVKRGREIILFDCGEGTQRQFQKSKLSYMQISKIFITHFHGDHFLGLPGLIQTMQLNDRNIPLHIYGPPGMNNLMIKLLSLGYFKPKYEIISHEMEANEEIKFEGYKIKAVSVKHNIPAYGYILKEDNRPGRFNKKKALDLGIPEGPLFSQLQKGKTVELKDGREIKPNVVLGNPRKGRKIVISGDTKPFKEMIEYAKDADILIHEATFESGMEGVSGEYGHSTSEQAAEIANRANVDKLYLVHISPRYNDNDEILKDAKKTFKKSYVAKDFQDIEVKYKK